MTTSLQLADFCSGDALIIDHTITGLPAPITNAEFGLKTYKTNLTNTLTMQITTNLTSAGQIVIPGAPQEDGSYTAEVVFTLTGDQTEQFLPPGVPTFAYIQVLPGPYTAELDTITPQIGGKNG